MPEGPNSDCVSTRQQRIAELAKQNPQMAFTSLNHYLDVEWLRAAFFRTRKNGAPGVDWPSPGIVDARKGVRRPARSRQGSGSPALSDA